MRRQVRCKDFLSIGILRHYGRSEAEKLSGQGAKVNKLRLKISHYVEIIEA